jgi:hypothetical protein
MHALSVMAGKSCAKKYPGKSLGWISASQSSEIRTGNAAWSGLKRTLGVESADNYRLLLGGAFAPVGALCPWYWLSFLLGKPDTFSKIN